MAKGIDKKLDNAWSKLVKLRAGNKCEIKLCGKTKYLNSHHIFTRRNKAVRWSVLNGVALCPGDIIHSIVILVLTQRLFYSIIGWLKPKGRILLINLLLKQAEYQSYINLKKK